MASELDPSMTSDEGGDRLGTMSDSSTGEVSETVKEWISEYEIRLGEFKAVIADIKPKLVKSTNEDVRMLILRAENTVVDLEHRVNALATISEVEATARKLGIDKLMTDVDTIIKESLQMAQTPSRGG